MVRRAAGSLVHRLWAAAREAGTVTPASPGGYRFRRLGEGACLSFPVGAIFGEAWIEIGEHSLIGERVSISAGMGPGVDLGPDSIVRIGRSCSIGRGSHIVGHQSIDIGDDVFTGPYVYITDQNHVYDDPEAPIGRQWPRNNPVSIGPGSWLGTGAIILPGTRIGRQCVVAGGAVVRGEFPDHSVIAGIPARVVRHYVPGRGWLPPHPDGTDAGTGIAAGVDVTGADVTSVDVAAVVGTGVGTDLGANLRSGIGADAGADLGSGIGADLGAGVGADLDADIGADLVNAAESAGPRAARGRPPIPE
ncbi:hypothetical protein GCM10017559_70180 [Streptosporangium longisporum]|uniref:Sugar acetyltransferase n=1 Tax=Streptosporangium longisporum TaxID=46187 RepID=A0ABP6L588_9ACTN